jgi:hypothetical protein
MMCQPDLFDVSRTHRSPTQASRILDYLLAGHRLTPLDALNRFGCMRLAARIHELRRQGYSIEEQTVQTPTGKRVAQYSILRLAA